MPSETGDEQGAERRATGGSGGAASTACAMGIPSRMQVGCPLVIARPMLAPGFSQDVREAGEEKAF